MTRTTWLVALAIGLAGGSPVALAQPNAGPPSGVELAPATPAAELAPFQPAPVQAQPATAAETGPVAATVNGAPIYAAEVDVPFDAMQKANRLGKEDPRWIKARMLSQLIDRKIADQALLEDKSLYTDEEVETQLKQLREAAQKQGSTLEKIAAAQGVSPEKLRHDISLRIAMQRYVQKQLLTVLPGYIREHQAEFDGTEIRASHILLRSGGYGDTFDSLSKRAKEIREEIVSGKLDFAAAARQYSQAPSSERGGDIGFVARRGVMLEPFSAVLFQLKPGEISPPVVTNVGIHLIQAGEVKRGTKDPKDSMKQIQQLAATQIVKQLIDDVRTRAKIEFTGAVPHFKPGTEELATP